MSVKRGAFEAILIAKQSISWRPPILKNLGERILRFSRTSSAEVQYYGALVGNLFVGLVADRFGRRRMLLISLAVGIPTLFLSGS